MPQPEIGLDPLWRLIAEWRELGGHCRLDLVGSHVRAGGIEGCEADSEIAEEAAHQAERPFEGGDVRSLRHVYLAWCQHAHEIPLLMRVQASEAIMHASIEGCVHYRFRACRAWFNHG
jgi:hypothetical protein